MSLTEEQRELTNLRLQEHHHARYEVDITLAEDKTLEGLVVHPNVLRPEKSSSLFLARYLYSKPDIYKDKDVLDLGCGCGIQGIVMSLGGAQSVTFSDISQAAIDNTLENIDKFNLASKTQVLQGDLFENIHSVFNVIVFNHPFWPAKHKEESPITRAMFDEGQLIHSFLDQAPKHLTKDGLILMPFFHLAGDLNNPEVQAKQHGYEIKTVYQADLNNDKIQRGLFSVFQLQKLNNNDV